MTPNNKKFEVFVDIKRRTQKAILVTDGVIEAWLPLSLIDIEKDPNKYNQATITMSERLAKEKGFILS